MSKFQISTNIMSDGAVVTMTGEADVAHVEAIDAAFEEALGSDAQRVVIDLSDLQFITSIGLGQLIEFRHDLNERGRQLRLCGAHEPVTDILKKTRLVELFPLYQTPEEALNASA